MSRQNTTPIEEANTLAQPVRFQPTGIDVGFFNWAALQVKNVNYQ